MGNKLKGNRGIRYFVAGIIISFEPYISTIILAKEISNFIFRNVLSDIKKIMDKKQVNKYRAKDKIFDLAIREQELI